MSSQDLVNAYMEMHETGQIQTQQQGVELSDTQVNSVITVSYTHLRAHET